MNTTFLTAYVLIWPFLSALVLAALVFGVVRDLRKAKRTGDEIV